MANRDPRALYLQLKLVDRTGSDKCLHTCVLHQHSDACAELLDEDPGLLIHIVNLDHARNARMLAPQVQTQLLVSTSFRLDWCLKASIAVAITESAAARPQRFSGLGQCKPVQFRTGSKEVTSERIRDKVAASKKKGIWMGGPVPLGYRLGDRKLVIDEHQAEIVRSIFRRYSELRSVTRLVEELAQQNVRTKLRQYSNGRTAGGVHFQRGSLSQLLQNPIYIGKVSYRGELYDGEHDGIIADDDWADVQSILAANRHDWKLGKQTRYPSLLTGMISDPDGRPMTPVSTHKGSRRHRYYVTRLKPGDDKESAWRVPAGELDSAVMAAVCDWLRSHERPGEPREHISDRDVAEELPDLPIPEQRKFLIERGTKAQFGETELRLSIGDEAPILIRLPMRIVRRGTELKVVLENGDLQRPPDPVLLKLVALAMSARKSLFSGKVDQLTSHYSKRHLWQLLRISFLAPDIIAAIVEGRQPPSLTGRRLLRVTELPLDWAGQRRVLGF